MDYEVAFTIDKGRKVLDGRYEVVSVSLSIEPTEYRVILRQAHKILRAQLNKTVKGKTSKICGGGTIHKGKWTDEDYIE